MIVGEAASLLARIAARLVGEGWSVQTGLHIFGVTIMYGGKAVVIPASLAALIK
jgi:hypothetical protein